MRCGGRLSGVFFRPVGGMYDLESCNFVVAHKMLYSTVRSLRTVEESVGDLLFGIVHWVR